MPARTKPVLGERFALDEDHVVHGGIRGRARDVVGVRPVVRLCIRQALSARTASAGGTRDAVVAFRGVWRPKVYFAPGRAEATLTAACQTAVEGGLGQGRGGARRSLRAEPFRNERWRFLDHPVRVRRAELAVRRAELGLVPDVCSVSRSFTAAMSAEVHAIAALSHSTKGSAHNRSACV